MASDQTFKTAGELIKEAHNVSNMIKQQREEEQRGNASPGGQKIESQVWLVSVAWFEKWKEATGFELLNEGSTLEESDAKPTTLLPQLNDDLIDHEKQKSISQVGKYLPTWSHYNVVLRLGIQEDHHFIYVNEKLWNYICAQYPNAIEVKRQAYTNSFGSLSYEIYGHLVKNL